ELQQPLAVPLGWLLDWLQLVVGADDNPGPVSAVHHILGLHHRQLVSRVEDKPHATLPTLADQPLHRAWIVWSDDDRVSLRRTVVQAEHRRPPHRAAVVTGELV